jgi:hypothetical protein
MEVEMEFVSVRTAAIVALALMGAVVLFHLLVIAGVIPKTIVWGGRITDPQEVVRMEVVSILIVLVAAAVFAFRWRSVATGAPSLLWAIATWALVGLFAINTVANLFAKTPFERFAMTPLTLLLALLALRLALERGVANG